MDNENQMTKCRSLEEKAIIVLINCLEADDSPCTHRESN
jgi:hypothetical protein